MIKNHHFNRNIGRFAIISLLPLSVILPITYNRIKQRDETQHLTQLQQIVHLIQSGTLKPNRAGDIILPSSIAQLTKNGRVYLSRDPTQQFIFFPEQIQPLEIEWQTGLPSQQRRPTEHKLQIAGYIYSQASLPNDSAINVDNQAVEPIFAELPAKRSGWYYAEPMPD